MKSFLTPEEQHEMSPSNPSTQGTTAAKVDTWRLIQPRLYAEHMWKRG